MDKYERIRNKFKEYKLSTVSDLDTVLHNFRILFAYNSGKIENEQIDYHDTREIFENGKVLSYSGDPRVLFEQQNQKLCYDFLREKIVSKEPISLELIKEVHAVLTAGTYDETRYIARGERPGEFKKYDYVTGIHEIGYSPEDVEPALSDLTAEINAYDGEMKLKAAAYFHLRFEYIHPFADGNGRAGRTLTNYYLLINGEVPHIIFSEDKKEYYKALEAYDKNEEIDPLYKFLKSQTVKTWENYFERRTPNRTKDGKSPAKLSGAKLFKAMRTRSR